MITYTHAYSRWPRFSARLPGLPLPALLAAVIAVLLPGSWALAQKDMHNLPCTRCGQAIPFGTVHRCSVSDDCGAAAAFMRAEVAAGRSAYSNEDISQMVRQGHCATLITIARNRGFKTSDDLRREAEDARRKAERQAADAKRKADRDAEDARRNAQWDAEKRARERQDEIDDRAYKVRRMNENVEREKDIADAEEQAQRSFDELFDALGRNRRERAERQELNPLIRRGNPRLPLRSTPDIDDSEIDGDFDPSLPSLPSLPRLPSLPSVPRLPRTAPAVDPLGDTPIVPRATPISAHAPAPPPPVPTVLDGLVGRSGGMPSATSSLDRLMGPDGQMGEAFGAAPRPQPATPPPSTGTALDGLIGPGSEPGRLAGIQPRPDRAGRAGTALDSLAAGSPSAAGRALDDMISQPAPTAGAALDSLAAPDRVDVKRADQDTVQAAVKRAEERFAREEKWLKWGNLFFDGLAAIPDDAAEEGAKGLGEAIGVWLWGPVNQRMEDEATKKADKERKDRLVQEELVRPRP